MNRRFWLGAITGAALITTLRSLTRTAATLALAATIRRMEMAETRTWTDEDDELRMLAYDIDRQQP